MTASTNCNCRDCLPRGQEPGEVLTSEEMLLLYLWASRWAERAKRGEPLPLIECLTRLGYCRMQFQRYRAERGRGGER